eukprot:TRINITY_DN1045_c0_g2_i2.p1 TRINITY_DN1045_c0_g2~~TRINITY_DN1045_c0_g2_i2.p1  ORF type:complete len:272 (-),score=57.49 TRINITY_DN1045_c0_g2_i2:19-762(-)
MCIRDSVKYALKDITFNIKRGEKIAVCGRTGSGKSSILNILFRFYDIQKGRILFNGVSIDTVGLSDLRRHMSIIPQLGFLFKGSLRDNLDPRSEVKDASIVDMFTKTGVSIRGVNESSSKSEEQKTEDLAEDKKVKLDYELENLGSNLSNGEKQIINFMRVFIHAQDLVCLDEANSNIDSNTDNLLMRSLFEVCKDKTILMISHRLENLRLFDKIIVLDSGRIVECGSFDELASNPSSHFNILRNAS